MTRSIACSVLVMTSLFGACAVSAQDKGTASITLSAASYAAGVLQPGETKAERPLTVDSARSLTLVITSSADLKLSLQLPGGAWVSSDKNLDDRIKWVSFAANNRVPQQLSLPGIGSGFNTLITMQAPAAGKYVASLAQEQPAAEPVPFLITLIEDSDIRLGLYTPFPDAVRGGPFLISAVLFDGTKPFRGARVTATLVQQPDDPAAPPIQVRELSLTDEGTGGDAKAGDGIYTGIVAPPSVGRYLLAVQAFGKSGRSGTFERHAGTSFIASEPTVTISSITPAALRTSTERGDMQSLTARVEFAAPPGLYEVVTSVVASNGNETSGNTLIDVRRKGLQHPVVSIDADHLRQLDSNGPYSIRSEEVYEITGGDRVLRARRLAAE